MRSLWPENTLVNLLRQCYLAPKCQASSRRLCIRPQQNDRTFKSSSRSFSWIPNRDIHDKETKSPISELEDSAGGFVLAKPSSFPTTSKSEDSGPPQPNIAVLGGGITGLSSAYYLTQQLPKANITLYESSERLGGWLHSKHVNVEDGTVIFEQGPRTLRPHTPAGLVTLDLIKKLGLEDEMLITDKNSIAARNRFLYYPDHLVRMPGPGQSFFENLWCLITEPVFKGLLWGLVNEYREPVRPDDLEDESVGSFLQRRLGTTQVGDNVVSAILHGIYAGDLYQLSMKSLQPIIWRNEKENDGILRASLHNMTANSLPMQERDYNLMREMKGEVLTMTRASEMNSASVYSFKRGIGALSDALVVTLKENPRVRIKTGEKVTKVWYDGESEKIMISTANKQPPSKFDKVISTIPGRTLSYLTSQSLPSLQATHAVTVMVVNLYYTDPFIVPVNGFGYLIPRSIPWNQNPERALGVIFDSDASIGQDTAPGTKVTVMIGGHWWDDFSSYPDEAEGTAMAKAVLKRHLKIDAEPSLVNVGIQRECIPQYTVGHDARMRKAHIELMTAFKGKLQVAGNSYTGVGLNDCVRAARDVVTGIKNDSPGSTGLQHFQSEKWVLRQMMASGSEDKQTT